MNTFLYVFIFFLNLLVFSFSSYPAYYTIPYLFSVRIGSQSKQIKLLLNSFNSNNYLFSNSNREYSKEISAKRKSDAFMDKLEFNAHIISDFPFTLILDNTGLNISVIQGEFGLGIDKDGNNDLIENLFLNQIVTKRKIILETSNNLIENQILTNAEFIKDEFKYCNLTRKSDLENLYSEAWVCELSHIFEADSIIDDKNIKDSWDNAKHIQARAIFDTRQKYLILPLKYLGVFENFWNLDSCEEMFDKSLDLKYFKCSNKTYEEIKNNKPFYFIIDGYGFEFNLDELFQEEGPFKISLIRFTEQISELNLIIFGVPLFKRYQVMFDYENKRLGFKGANITNFTSYYHSWKEEKTIIKITEEKTSSQTWRSGKALMTIGALLGIFIIIYVLFIIIRSSKRNDANKIHSAFVEQVNDY